MRRLGSVALGLRLGQRAVITLLLTLVANEAGRASPPLVEVHHVVGVLLNAGLCNARKTLVAHDLGGTEVHRVLEECCGSITNRDWSVETASCRKDIAVPVATLLLALLVVLASEHGFAIFYREHECTAAAAVGQLQTEAVAEHLVDLVDRTSTQRQLLGRLVHHLRFERHESPHLALKEREHRKRVGNHAQPFRDALLDCAPLAAQSARQEFHHREHLQEARGGDGLHVVFVPLKGNAFHELTRHLGVLAGNDVDILGEHVAPESTTNRAIAVHRNGVVVLVSKGKFGFSVSVQVAS